MDGMREFSIRDPNGYLVTLGSSADDGEHEHEQPHPREDEVS